VTMSVQAYLTREERAREDRPQERPGTTEQQLYLHPGQLCFTTEDMVVSTVLGSCVSICLYDEAHAATGVNHFLLPERGARIASPRFGDSANEALLERFQKIGVKTAKLRAKVFGGASMGGSSAGDLASRNVEVALAFLRSNDIPIVSQDTGGERGRKLIFRTCDATAWVRLLGGR
jgi:chemotaxis protein CheD